METRPLATLAIASLVVVQAAAQVSNPVCDPSPARLILDLPEQAQLACFNDWLARGMLVPAASAISVLVRARSAIVLPILEKKVEEVLVSKTPLDYFTDKTVDPKRFVDLGASTIAEANNELALRELSKLMRLDEQRFSRLHVVQRVLFGAQNIGNPYVLAYRGLEIGDPAIDRGIVAWAEELLGDETKRFSNPSDENMRGQRWAWAEALVQRYGGAPDDRPPNRAHSHQRKPVQRAVPQSGWGTSTVASAAYTITGSVATPTFGVPAGTYTTPQTHSLKTTTPEATIRYTTDGSTPTETAGIVYFRANCRGCVAYETAWLTSGVASATPLTPTPAP
jgi:hypothetical protein